MEIVFTKQTIKDFEKIKTTPLLLKKVRVLLELIEVNPFSNSPSYEKLINIHNVYSLEGLMLSTGWFTRFMRLKPCAPLLMVCLEN